MEVFDDPVLTSFKAALAQLYGDRLERVVLYGSAHADSDYDLAVFLRTVPDRWAETRRLADLRAEFIDRTGAFFDAQPFPTSAYDKRTPVMHEIRRVGRDV